MIDEIIFHPFLRSLPKIAEIFTITITTAVANSNQFPRFRDTVDFYAVLVSFSFASVNVRRDSVEKSHVAALTDHSVCRLARLNRFSLSLVLRTAFRRDTPTTNQVTLFDRGSGNLLFVRSLQRAIISTSITTMNRGFLCKFTFSRVPLKNGTAEEKMFHVRIIVEECTYFT